MTGSMEQPEFLFDQPVVDQHDRHLQAPADVDGLASSSALVEPLSIEERIADKIEEYIKQLLASDEAGELKGAEIVRIGLCAKVEINGITTNISIPHWRPEKRS